MRTSVLLAFSWSRLLRIHSATSSTHADTCSWSCDTADGGQEPYICVSSAYKCGQSWYLSTSRSKSAVYITNRIGPRTDPCGTPHRRKATAEETVLRRTFYCDWKPYAKHNAIKWKMLFLIFKVSRLVRVHTNSHHNGQNKMISAVSYVWYITRPCLLYTSDAADE